MRYDEISKHRTDLCPDEEYLQISGRKLEKGVKVDAHKHTPINRTTDITQEAWVVFEGRIKGTFYDLEGDVIVLFRGGHSLEALDEYTIFYEFKTGPYFGVEADKEMISEK